MTFLLFESQGDFINKDLPSLSTGEVQRCVSAVSVRDKAFGYFSLLPAQMDE